VRYYEIAAEIEIEVRHKRLAENSDQAEEISERVLQNAVARGLKDELSAGESSIDVEIEDAREANDVI
jgi:hypothetical protein